MSAGRYWMRLSRFLTMAASWSTSRAARLPRPFFMVRPDALGRVEVRGVGGQPDLGQPVRMGAGERAHHGADVGVEVVPDQDDRGLQLLVRGGDQAGVVGFGHRCGARPCVRGGCGPGRTGGPARRACRHTRPATDTRPEPLPDTRPPGSGRGAPRSGPSAGAGSARPRPRSTSTPRSPPLASYLRPGHGPPRGDRRPRRAPRPGAPAPAG